MCSRPPLPIVAPPTLCSSLSNSIYFPLLAHFPRAASVTLKGAFKVGELSVDKLELTADKLNLEFSSVFSGVKVSVKGSDAARSLGADGINCNVVADYVTKDYNLNLDTSLVGKSAGTTSLSGVFNVGQGFSLGGSLTAAPATITAPSAYNVALSYKGAGYSFGVVTDNKFKDLNLGYHASAGSDVTVGATVKMPTPAYNSGAIAAEAGLTYKASKEATVHAKAGMNGKVSLAFAHVLSPLATLTIATEMDASNISSDDHKLGMLLAIKA